MVASGGETADVGYGPSSHSASHTCFKQASQKSPTAGSAALRIPKPWIGVDWPMRPAGSLHIGSPERGTWHYLPVL